MHEYSVVQALLDQCEDYAKANDATKVTKVVLKIGVMSGIETELLERAFDTFKEKTVCDDAELVINKQALTIECRDCKKVSELEKNHYLCPNCKSTNLKIVDGEEMFLMSLEME